MVTSSSTSVTSQKYKTTRSVGAGTKDFKSLRLLLIHGWSDEFKTAMCERESTQTVMISSKVFHQRCLANRGNFSYAPMRSCIINKAQSCRTSLNCVMHSVMYLQHCLLYLCECSSHRRQETASSQEFTLHGRVAKGHSVDFLLVLLRTDFNRQQYQILPRCIAPAARSEQPPASRASADTGLQGWLNRNSTHVAPGQRSTPRTEQQQRAKHIHTRSALCLFLSQCIYILSISSHPHTAILVDLQNVQVLQMSGLNFISRAAWH